MVNNEIFDTNKTNIDKKKKKRKQKIHDIPEELLVIKNLDKDEGDWQESWTPKRSPGLIPHPFRILALGSVGRGKTNSLKNIFLKHQASSKPFKKLYVITCDVESAEWTDCEPDILTDELLEINDFDPSEKTALVIDDYEFVKLSKDDQRKLSTLMRYISSHRNVSIFLSFQSFFDCPSVARKCANVFMIYKPNSKQECTTIENRCGLEKGTLTQLFKTVCKKPYDHVLIDKSVNSPFPLRRNIYEILDIDDSF